MGWLIAVNQPKGLGLAKLIRWTIHTTRPQKLNPSILSINFFYSGSLTFTYLSGFICPKLFSPPSCLKLVVSFWHSYRNWGNSHNTIYAKKKSHHHHTTTASTPHTTSSINLDTTLYLGSRPSTGVRLCRSLSNSVAHLRRTSSVFTHSNRRAECGSPGHRYKYPGSRKKQRNAAPKDDSQNVVITFGDGSSTELKDTINLSFQTFNKRSVKTSGCADEAQVITVTVTSFIEKPSGLVNQGEFSITRTIIEAPNGSGTTSLSSNSPMSSPAKMAFATRASKSYHPPISQASFEKF